MNEWMNEWMNERTRDQEKEKREKRKVDYLFQSLIDILFSTYERVDLPTDKCFEWQE